MATTTTDTLRAAAPDHVTPFLDAAILRVQVGSEVYGTAIDASSDHDELGVFVLPPQNVLGISPTDDKTWRTAPEGARSTPDDLDLSMYSARKYVSLATQGNPSILVALFTPDHQTYTCTQEGTLLRESAHLFHTKQSAQRFLGYMTAQFKRMEDSRAGTRAPRSNRPELIEKYGYDTKFAAHAVRLGFQGLEFLRTGTMQLPIPDPEGETLRAIRQGHFDYDDVFRLGEDLTNALKTAIDNADIPSYPDRDRISQMLSDIHFLAWSTRRADT